MTTRTDARAITTTVAYDVLNRPTTKTYSDGTPAVAFFYDGQTLPAGAPSFSRGYSTGRLVAVTYGGGSAGNYAGFDALGRSLRKIQQTDSVNYLTEASYNVSGSMISETYPSVPGYGDRRTVIYGFDTAGRLSSLNSNATTYAPAASVNNIGYASHGALNTETYGNGLVHAATYNTRMQVNEIRLGTSSNPTKILDLAYNYGTTNNGNLQSIAYSLDVGGYTLPLYTQSFSYDGLNRVATASETSGSNTSWSQTNGYDRYGNRWVDLGGGNQSLSFSTSTNRITTSGYSFDASGNLTNDTINAYTYDAEGHIKTVNTTTAYVYDGSGARVRKLVGENTRFVYGNGGELIAEFAGATGDLLKEYIYGGGSMITIAPGDKEKGPGVTQYLTSDQLGTPRVITNSSGSVVARHDYLPFAEELFAGTGARTTAMGFGANSANDDTRQKFTGYEADKETGLNFAQARYQSSPQGRFTSPDPFGGSMLTLEPQSFNRYAYVGNNPLTHTDPTGLLESAGGLPGDSSALGRAHPGEGFTEPFSTESEAEPGSEPITATDEELFAGLEEILAAAPQQQQQSNLMTATNGNAKDETTDRHLGELLTNGGIVRGASAYRNLLPGDNHFRLSNGTLHTLHIFGDESGTVLGGVYIPKEFSQIRFESPGVIAATNPRTGEIIGANHINVTSQPQLDRNLRMPTNAKGSRYIGQIGGRGGDGTNDTHAHLSIFPNAESRRIARTYKGDQTKQLRDFNSKIAVHLGDFRRLLR